MKIFFKDLSNEWPILQFFLKTRRDLIAIITILGECLSIGNINKNVSPKVLPNEIMILKMFT